jgi:NAD(P)-dependent dehydrogenase (short-subunit alcohol dehydrogenase family)
MQDGNTGLLADRVLVLIGADEIGAGIARRFSREGASVAILDQPGARAASLAADLAKRYPACSSEVDYGNPQTIVTAIQQAARSLGRIDILVTNTLPAASPNALENQTDAAFTAALNSTVTAAGAMRAVLPFMRTAGSGRIIHVGHRYGETIGEAIAPYNCAAWSLVGLTRTAALEWGQFQITTNLLLPVAATEEFQAACAARAGIIDLLVAQLPLRRAGDPTEDIGGAALFLASADACFVNGQTLFADGGQHTAGPVLNPAKFAQRSTNRR